jgi:thioester reductase-like protein
MATVGGSIVFLEKLPPSQEDISFALGYNKCTTMCAPPLILEQMINYLKETNDYSKVNALNYVVFGGAPLKHEAGEWLHAHGVNVRDMYGSTEIGGIMSADMDPKSKNWGSIRAFGADEEGKPYCVFEVNDPADPTVFHLYIRGDSPTLANGVANRPDGGYDTNDLFLEDSHFPGYYIYQGRRDDVLIMENGEKTNPVPMESAIRQFPIVSQVAVIGSGRQLTAALVSLDTQYALNMTPEEMINAVHDAVKEANKECPNHSTILPQMVKILPLNKQLPSTDKGTVMRKKAELQFKDVVEKLYKNFLDGPVRSETNNEDVSTWKHEQTKNFLIESVSKVLNMPTSTFKDRNQSLFDFGLNSLTSIQFRNMIAQYFDDVAQNFIFQHPTINSLCDALMSNETEDALEQTEQRYEQTQKLAQEYLKKANKDFGVAKNNYDESKPKVVFLTGATGSLGSFMLRDLLNDPTVKKVYCAVRGKKEQLYNRLIEAFESRSLDVSLLEDTDRVEALSMNFSEPYLGYGKELYEQLKEEVTIIQHCAWLLNFNMPVDHFDNECIAPFYNLLKFAYKDVNPMHVHFISSISASAGAGAEIEEIPLPLDSHVTMPMGYAQSKFVVEILFNFLTTQKNFPCYIERLGQVCGDSVNGVWNVSEQYPLMFIGGGSIMHKMPELDTVIDWITVDYAAASIVDIMLRTANLNANQGQSIYHIVNPRIVHWSDILDSMKASGMKFDVVSPNEWVETLSKDDTNPSFRLMSFYESNFNESFKMPIWQTEKTKEVTPIIENSPVLDANLFTKFLQRWESVGFYDPSM